MTIYLVITGEFHEYSTAEADFYVKQKAQEYMDRNVKKINKETRINHIKWKEDPDAYRYYMEKRDDGSWDNGLNYYEIQKIRLR